MPYDTDHGTQQGDPPPGWAQDLRGIWQPPGQNNNPLSDNRTPANPNGDSKTPPPAPSAEDEARAKAAADAKAAEAARIAAYNNHFQYGGYAGGAESAGNLFDQRGFAAEGRKGEVIDTTNANADRATSLGDRGNQSNVADLMYNRATGKTPSIAGMRADQDMRTLTANQTSQAASARGPAGLALAQQGAAANTAQGTSTISNLAQINSAQERSDAEKAAMAGYTGIRGQDAAQQGQDFNQADAQAKINAAQRAANDQYSQGLFGDSIDIRKAQLAAQGNQVGIETGASTASANRDAATNIADANRTAGYVGTAAGAVGTGLAVTAPAWLPGLGGPSKGTPGATNPADASSGPTNGNNDVTGGDPSADQGGNSDDPWGNGDGTSDYRAKQEIVPLYEEPGSGIERHYDRDVSKAKPDVMSGASLSGPTPKYSSGDVYDRALAPASPRHQATRKLTDAELDKMAAGLESHVAAQRTALENGSSVHDRDVYDREPPAWLRDEMEPRDVGAERYAYSDDHTKVVAAQREAFRAGLNHANTASETGTIPEAPAYMQERAERRQPAAAPRQAATPQMRVDPELQREENTRAQGVYDRADAAALMGPALGLGATLASNHGRLREDADQYDRNLETAPVTRYAPEPNASYSDERTKRVDRAESDMGVALAEGYKPYEYEYKPGFAQRERQQPGEKNVGPMAQDMASNSITGSAVKRGPDGLLMVDIPKMSKVNSAGIGYLAQKQEEMQPSLHSALEGVKRLHERVRDLEKGGR